jgi:hypothetical protein
MQPELTPQHAKERYQNKVPRMRENFERRLKDIHAQATSQGYLFKTQYRAEVVQAAFDEVRQRNDVAKDSVEKLLASGWKPATKDDVGNCFRDCFNPVSHDKESFTDLSRALSRALDWIGQRDPQACANFERELGSVQLQAANECLSDLGMYEMKSERIGVKIEGPVGAFQYGSGSVAHVTQNINPQISDLISALTALKNASNQHGDGATLAVMVEGAQAEIGQKGLTDRAKTLLGDIPKVLPVAAAIAPAYELVRGAALALGYDLPPLPH